MGRRLATVDLGPLDDWSAIDLYDDRLPDEPALWPDSAMHELFAGNGRSPLPCPTCDLPTWDGIHATGHRACYTNEVPGV